MKTIKKKKIPFKKPASAIEKPVFVSPTSQLRNLADDVAAKMSDLGQSWVRLCEFVRLNSFVDAENVFVGMTPNEVVFTLKDAGFPDSRISEVKAVAYSTDEIWESYKSRLIGFRAALEAVRNGGAVENDKSVLALNRIWAALERGSKKGLLPTEGRETKKHVVVTWTKAEVGTAVKIGDRYIARLEEIQ